MEVQKVKNIRVRASTYNNKFDNEPKSFEGTLFDLIGEKHIVSKNKDSNAFSFAVYEPGRKRANENVKAVYGLGFDLDDVGEEVVRMIANGFKKEEVAHIIHTSYSHKLAGESCNRIRVLCPLSRPVNKEEYTKLWDYYYTAYGEVFDESAKDPSRMLYLPRVHPDVKRYAAIKYFDGIPIDPDVVLSKEPVIANKKKTKKKRGRNTLLTSLAGKLRSSGKEQDEIERELLDENANFKDPLDDREVKSIAKSIAKYDNKKEDNKDAMELAQEFIEQHDGEVVQLNSDVFVFNRVFYEEQNQVFFKSRVVSFLQRQGVNATPEVVSSILLNISGLCSRKAETIPFPLDSKLKGLSLLPLQNGLLDVRRAMNHEADALLTNNGGYFALGAAEYPYLQGAECPIWLNQYLKIIQPDPEMQNLLQEVMGYALLHDFNLGKIILLLGDGANGKSVYVIVLQLIAGLKNCSNVPLESMSLQRTFPLWEMVGKLINVAEEIGDIEKSEEGLLKNIVTGGRVCIERKYRDPASVQLLAKMFFCANAPPKFKDRTSGIWRRIISIPFNVQILDESQQNPNFVDPKWWTQSGELPGILNWALVGLKRLVSRGYFAVPASCVDYCSDYRLQSNPAAVFLAENCAVRTAGRVSTKGLYRTYASWCKENGYYPLNANAFSREVYRTFKDVCCSANAQRIGGERTRVWEGIVLES